MDLTQSVIFLVFLIVALAHHGRTSFKKGRTEGVNEGIEITLGILTSKGIININEAEEILRIEK